jgi:hypothetical protein
LVLDGTITAPFFLADADFDTIESKLVEIGFFDYPDTFIVGLGDSIIGYIDPPVGAFFDVKQGSVTKTLFWVDGGFTLVVDPRVEKLSEAFFLIRSIIESKPAYQRLPPARGGYI